jgi:hypothetical protein
VIGRSSERTIRRTAECEECGAVFVPEHGRQRFCPPPQWLDSDGRLHGPRQSLCSKRAYMREFRARKRSGT